MKAPKKILGHWFRSASGVAARVTGTVEKDKQGEKLYRLFYLSSGLRGHCRYTEESVRKYAHRWLKGKPRR
jgi:hypothetical protein